MFSSLRLFVCVLACVCIVGLFNPGRAATLVDDGQATSTIVVDPAAAQSSHAAAAMLADYLQRISGAKVAIVDSPDAVRTPVTIWVGWHEALPARFASVPALQHKPSSKTEVVIACQGNDVAILGPGLAVNNYYGDVDTLDAMYSFLRRNLGVRWFWPGELGEDVPRQKTIALANEVYEYAPPLRWRVYRMNYYKRWVSFYPGDRQGLEQKMQAMDTAAIQWAQRHHHGGPVRMAGAHAFIHWYERYHESNPDFFALQPDGTRDPYPDAKNVKMCISNPAVVEQWVNNAVAFFERYPNARTISAAINDSAYSGFCTCPDCEALDPTAGPMITLQWKGVKKKHVALTDRFASFYNRLAKKLGQRLGDREFYIVVLAYAATRTAPVNVKLDHRIIVGFVGGIPYSSEEGRQRDKALWQAWGEKASHLFWRPNMYHYNWGLPGIFPKNTGEDFKFLADHHMAGIDIDSFFNHWSTQGLQYYLLARLSWEPYLDVQTLVDDYVTRAFGSAAAPHMKQYFELASQGHERWAEHLAGLDRFEAIDRFPEIYPPRWLAELKTHLDAAVAAAQAQDATATQQQRLAFMATGHQYMTAQLAAITAMKALRYGSGNDLVAIARQAVEATTHRDAILAQNIESFALSGIMYHANVARRQMKAFLGPPDETYARLAADETDNRNMILPMSWRFRLDPQNLGISQKWYDKTTAAQLDWRPIRVTSWWDDQLLNDDPVDPVNHGYLGAAWYAVTFDAQPPKGLRAWLVFGAIDESCDVYLNGQRVGHQVFNPDKDIDAWEKPRRFDVTNVLRQGRNELVVRVESNAGKGGIYKPVTLAYTPANIIPNGDFENQKEGWVFHALEELADTTSFDFTHGQHVDETSLHVKVGDQTEGRVSVRTHVASPLAPGRYMVRLHYRHKLEVNMPSQPPIRMRVVPRPETGKPDPKKYLWLKGQTQAGGQPWRVISDVLVVDQDQPLRGVTLTVFFYEPGEYQVDQVVLEPLE